ncbi:expressed unknown protein [Seminavis robusta]|uniref:CS domain-containing protein n=1 Tax=Seminavis robusta TaxID=568900 RepID=A0A9N8DA79_9STRA|nr:expressed unknown protein [Seminavis robusta]|eukprot:Sro13_g009980.1 n/a (175) ;mRNA; f:81376-81900
MTDPAAEEKDTSALRDNINKKGSNAYYFAHANTASGPDWDGKLEPKLLATTSSSVSDSQNRRHSSFDVSKSNITSYAFCDEGATVKLYITMEGVGEKCTEEDITLENTENSFCFAIENYKEEPMCLSFLKLTAEVSKVTFKLKPDRVVLILRKVDKSKTWHTINDKGTADHEVV